jgi:UDP-N-acetylglucosamine 2-epimerase (non-hydrolysing)
MRKILIVFGTRPEAIKMAPIIQKLKSGSSKLKPIICVTSQHRELLDQVLRLFEITPDYDLNIMTHNQNLFDVTISVLQRLREVMTKEMPDLVLVQGDTTSTMVTSLAAFYLRIPVGHIEAGLRTYNNYAPFPEEVNRHIVGVIADYHFAPTEWAKSNLIKEGVPKHKIFVTGNTVIDALIYIMNKIKESDKQKYYDRMFDFLDKGKKLVLITGHRRENFGEGFENICAAIKELSLKFSDHEFLYPVHLNPNVQTPVHKILGNGDLSNVHLTESFGYLPFLYIMSKAYLIITDSGGIQEEAPYFGKPVLIMRNTTERPEGVAAGIAKLVGADKDTIIRETEKLLCNTDVYSKMANVVNPYGDGRASERIVNILEKFFSH